MNDISKAGFYKTWYEQVKFIKDPAKQHKFLMMILEYYFENVVPAETDEFFFVFMNIRASIDADIAKRTAGKKGGTTSKKAEPSGSSAQSPEPVEVSFFTGEVKDEQTASEKTASEVVTESTSGAFSEPNSLLISNVNVNDNENEEGDNVNVNVARQSSPPPEENPPQKSSEPDSTQNIDLQLSQMQQRYAQIVFERFKNAGLPCANGNFTSFLMRDFYEAMPLLKGYHSNEILKAIDNYIFELKAKDSYRLRELSFSSFLQSKTFKNCLPDNYRHSNFVRNGIPEPPKQEQKNAVDEQNEQAKNAITERFKNHPENCEKCGRQLEDSSGGSGALWFCRNCHIEYSKVGNEWRYSA